jgi:hypothetical protein
MSFGEREREKSSRRREELLLSIGMHSKAKVQHKIEAEGTTAKGRTVWILERSYNREKYSSYNRGGACISRQVGTEIKAHLMLEISYNKPRICGMNF